MKNPFASEDIPRSDNPWLVPNTQPGLEILEREDDAFNDAFIFEGMCKGVLNVVVGKRDVGKSMFALQFAFSAASESANKKLLNIPFFKKRHKVTLIDAGNNGEELIEKRVQAIGERIGKETFKEASQNIIAPVWDQSKIFNDDPEAFWAEVKEVGTGSDILILDRLINFWPDKEAMGTALMRLADLASELDTAVLLIYHQLKDFGFDARVDYNPEDEPEYDLPHTKFIMHLGQMTEKQAVVHGIQNRTNYRSWKIMKQSYKAPNSTLNHLKWESDVMVPAVVGDDE